MGSSGRASINIPSGPSTPDLIEIGSMATPSLSEGASRVAQIAVQHFEWSTGAGIQTRKDSTPNVDAEVKEMKKLIVPEDLFVRLLRILFLWLSIIELIRASSRRLLPRLQTWPVCHSPAIFSVCGQFYHPLLARST
jgi:hypothetical protein